jgi:hypothetical protein
MMKKVTMARKMKKEKKKDSGIFWNISERVEMNMMTRNSNKEYYVYIVKNFCEI